MNNPATHSFGFTDTVSPTELLAFASEQGIEVSVNKGDLVIGPRGKESSAIGRSLIKRKAEILEHLRDGEELLRVRALWPRITPSMRRAILAVAESSRNPRWGEGDCMRANPRT